MRYLTFSKIEKDTYPICILVPVIRREEIKKAYVDAHTLDSDEVIVIDLHYLEGKKKTPVAEFKRYIKEELIPTWTDLNVEFLVVTDPEYFKVLSGAAKADANLGYVMDCLFGPWKVIYVPNQRQIFYDPEKIRGKIVQGINAMKAYRAGGYEDPGAKIIHYADYPQTAYDIETWLLKFLEWDRPLTCDIETFSLKHHSAGIGTITFCWSQHEGIAFPVDLGPEPELVRDMLKAFFIQFQNKLIYHKADFDVYVLIYQLFMKDILDTKGLLEGLEIMLRPGGWEDTRLISYFATNSCAGNKLSLKDQAQEFAGNYALLNEDPDITKIPLPDLLRYNLVDGLSTWFVHLKHWDTMVTDQQLSVYEDVFKPALVDIVQMQLTGLPVNMNRVVEAKRIFLADFDAALKKIHDSPVTQKFVYWLNEQWVAKKNSILKVKRVTLADAKEEFNPNSGPQLQALLFDRLQLPVLATTDSGQPGTGGEVLKDLKNHTEDPDILAFLDAMIDYGTVVTLLETFIPALEGAVQGPDGWHYLFGNFNLGGTIGGRLSSSNPNLQNLPAGADPNSLKGKYGKLIKWCIQAPPGWMLTGLDFAALEDKISALTTKDPNKLAVYQGHIVYALDIDGVIHHIRDDSIICYEGQKYSGAELYRELASNCAL